MTATRVHRGVLMASFGHVAVGMALARVSARDTPTRSLAPRMLACAALALLPDADVVAFALGIPYAATWGHRGASHSLVLAAAVALGVALLTRAVGGPARSAGLLTLLAVGSHGPLDAMTTGGLGPALLWPFEEARHFFPWRPIPVAPIGGGMLSARGAYVLAVEALLFLPFWAYALWPRRRRPTVAGES
ncbi:metal-dependent hydrolase [Archangium primigenium]|uniref:metal-dependent hydrolase n=1 Tax=[Archangium] primigenium TaxID=2792470 RepID=UPI001EF8AAC1|nr:metal-dependent hydrolase [Archangium primigenium]